MEKGKGRRNGGREGLDGGLLQAGALLNGLEERGKEPVIIAEVNQIPKTYL